MERQSNIEFLRMVVMFFVLVLHTNYLSIGEPNFNSVSLFEFVVRNFIENFNFIAVNVFVLISGFFSINLTKKSITNYFFTIIFYSVGLRLIWLLVSLIFKCELNIPYFIESFFFLSNSSWFVLDYLMLMLFSPMLNQFAEQSSKRSLLITIVLILFAGTWFGILGDCDLLGCERGYSTLDEYKKGKSFLTFMTIYLIGRYLRLHFLDNIEHNLSIKQCVVGYCLCGSISLMLSLIVSYIGKWSFVIYTYSNPIFIFTAVFFFLLFLKIRVSSKTINRLAVSAFAVYLIHSNPVVIYKYMEYFKYLYANNSFILYLLYVFISCILIYVVSILLDQLRLYLYKKYILVLVEK